MDENIFDLSPEAFQAAIAELRTMGYDTDDLTRQYRSANSPFASINNAADNFQQGLADDGRRSVLGGLLSKVEGSTGMDAIRGLNFEGLGGLLGAGQAVGQAIDAPGAAYQGLIPRGDMAGEAMNVAGMAMGAGGAATAPGGALRMGLAREGLSEAQRQARDILNMRAAGRAGDVTDDMMARADPQYMYDNTPLPMDEASRLARADAGGFGGNVYHGSGNLEGFDRFNNAFTGQGNDQLGSGFYFTNEPSTANAYSTAQIDPSISRLGGDTSPGVIPAMIRQENPIRLQGTDSSINNVDMTARQAADIMRRAPNIMDVDESGMGNWHDVWSTNGVQDWMIDDVAKNYQGPNILSLENDFFRGESGAFRAAAADVLGYDGVVQPLGGGEIHNVVWNPQQARSRFARFDPEFSHLSNLSAANASPAGLLAMQPEQETRPLPFMEMLRGLLR
jgi:hypothetical protein